MVEICGAGWPGPIRINRNVRFKEAKGTLVDRRKEIKDGKDPIPVKRMPNYTFRELAESYLEWAERQKGFRSKKAIVRILVGIFGNVPLKHLNTRIIEAYQTRMLSEVKAPATCNRHLATLKRMITKAIQWEMAPEDVLKKVRQVKLLSENNRRLRFLTVEESQELIKACFPSFKAHRYLGFKYRDEEGRNLVP